MGEESENKDWEKGASKVGSASARCQTLVLQLDAFDNVHLGREHPAADRHGDGDDGKIDTSKVQSPDVNVLALKDIPPKQAGEGGIEGR